MPVDCQKLVILDTQLGFLGLVFKVSTVLHLSLGYTTYRQVITRVSRGPWGRAEPFCEEQAMIQYSWIRVILTRLQRYTDGQVEEFSDVPLDHQDAMTPFTRRVVAVCRQIPYGYTLSYAELAKRAGSPGAARSVGTVMAKNRFALLVPCHRVVAAGGRLGGFSAAGGTGLKRRLLALEAAASGQPMTIR